MANIKFLDGDGNAKYLQSISGAGTVGDPYVGSPATSLTDLLTRVGETQASPTQYTVQDRLKALLTGIVVAAGANVIGGVTQSGSWTVAVSGTTLVSASSLPLPTGASTAAKQPALGVAGTASTDVITVQGIASMTALKVDGSAVTQPVSGTVTANAGTGTFTVAGAVTGSGTFTVGGVAAQGASVSGNPLLQGGEARDGLGTVVADGQVVRAAHDRYGRARVVKPKITQASSNGTPITTATDTQAIAAPAASHHLRIHRLHATNAGATSTYVYWCDASGGTKRYPMYLPQNGFASLDLGGSWELTTAHALFINTSAAGSVEWHADYETVDD